MNKIIEKAVNEIHQAKEEFFKMGYAIYEIFMPDFVIEEFKKISVQLVLTALSRDCRDHIEK